MARLEVVELETAMRRDEADAGEMSGEPGANGSEVVLVPLLLLIVAEGYRRVELGVGVGECRAETVVARNWRARDGTGQSELDHRWQSQEHVVGPGCGREMTRLTVILSLLLRPRRPLPSDPPVHCMYGTVYHTSQDRDSSS